MKSSRSQTQIAFSAAFALLISGLAAPFAVAQQQKPAPAAHNMEHMQHEHGGFMQEGMHHAVAKGVKIQQQVDAASHTITLREGPLTLPANTDHIKMPQPADLFWTISLDAFLRAYTPRVVDAN